LSLERRRELLALAAEYEFTIFEDDPYVEIRFRGENLPSMLSLDTTGSVVNAGSFTKTVCPGVRVGYLIGPTDTIAEITKRAVNTYISPNMLSEVTVHQFCASGDIDRSIVTVRRRWRNARACSAGHFAARFRAVRSPSLTAATSSGWNCPSTLMSTSWYRSRQPTGWLWSREATSCLLADTTRCGWRSRRCSPIRSTRAYAGSRRLSRICEQRPEQVR